MWTNTYSWFCSSFMPQYIKYKQYKGAVTVLDSTVRARVDSQLKNEVESIFGEIGLTTSQAITLFLKRVKFERGIPFELKIPNNATQKAIEEAENMDGEIMSIDELKK